METEMNVMLIIVLVVMMMLLLFCVGILIVKFGHPNDKNQAKFPKAIVALGLWMAFASILVLPYDVANARGSGGGIRVDIIWQILYAMVALMVFVVIPYAYFFYESDVDEDPAQRGGCCDSQAGAAAQYTFCFTIIFVVILGLMFAFLHTAYVPVTRVINDLSMVHSLDPTLGASLPSAGDGVSNVQLFEWKIPVSFPIYIMAFLSFIGWFFFSMFLGVGLMALPLDLINEYRTRPTPLSAMEMITQKKDIGARAAALVATGEAMREMFEKRDGQSRSDKATNRKNMRKFEQNFYLLKKDKSILDMSFRLRGGEGELNPGLVLWPIAKLLFGVCGIFISLTWVIHIAIFMLPTTPIHPFLNNFFIELESAIPGFPLFGVTAYAIWGFYLLWCVVKGNFKLGLRFFIWKVYPMEINNTMMNAFLANTWIILLCSVPAVQFCTSAFPVYARYTEIDMLFGTQIQYLEFFRIFWEFNVFNIATLVFVFLTTVALVLYPIDQAAVINKKLDALAKEEPRV